MPATYRSGAQTALDLEPAQTIALSACMQARKLNRARSGHAVSAFERSSRARSALMKPLPGQPFGSVSTGVGGVKFLGFGMPFRGGPLLLLFLLDTTAPPLSCVDRLPVSV